MAKLRINSDGSINMWKLPIELDSTWRDAILPDELPVLTSTQVAVPQYDLTKTPIVVTYSIVEATLEERKLNETVKVKGQFVQIANQQANNEIVENSEVYDVAVVEQAKQTMITKLEAISSATTHEELDAIV